MTSIKDSPLTNEIKETSDDAVKQEGPINDSMRSDDGELLSAEQRRTAEAKIKRLLDRRLLPTIILIYLMNYIDRTAITSARLKGLQQDLHLSDIQYDTVVAILYASYAPAQIPSNIIINKVTRPSLYIGTCVVLWGLVSAMTGVTHSYAGIMLCRIFIGLPEAAFYPGAIYLLSRWYTKKELSFRAAILYAGLLVSNAFGSLIAAGVLSNMEGALGIRAWRWLFFIEGSITMCLGFLAMWALPDFPHNTRWLTLAERRLARIRLSEDAGEADEDTANDSSLQGLKLALSDVRVWIFALIECAENLGLSFTIFLPTLTKTLGYNTTITLLMAAPPWILVAVVTCLNAWSADRTGERFFHFTWSWIVAIIGYIIGISTMSVAGRYVSLFLMASGNVGFALTLVWVVNAIPRPPAKRAAAIAIVNGIGNIGNVMGSYVWKSKWGPEYRQSMAVCIASLALSTLLAFVMRCMLKSENRRLEENERSAISPSEWVRVEDAAKLEGISFEEAMERKQGFRNLY